MNGDAQSTRQDDQLITKQIATPLSLAIAIFLLIDFLFFGNLFTSNYYMVIGFTTAVVLLSFTHHLKSAGFGEKHGLYLTLYHLVISFMLIFITPAGSYYSFIWVLFLCVSEFYYRFKGFVLSALIFAAASIGSLYYQTNIVSLHKIIDLAPSYIFALVLAAVVAQITMGDREQRIKISKQIVDARYEHERLVILINSMSDAVIATEEDGTITLYNSATLNLLDTNISLNGKRLSDILHVIDKYKEPVDLMEKAKADQSFKQFTNYVMPVSENDQMALDITISRISAATTFAKQQGYMFILRDITRQKSLDEERDLFISEVSHELRTPITIAEGSMSMASLLSTKEPYDPLKVKETVDKAHEQVVLLANIINDLSTLSRAEREDKDMEVQTFPVEDIITELRQAYVSEADSKGLYLTINMQPDLPPVTTSRIYLHEILQNIIGNAVKYTNKGGVIVTVSRPDSKNVMIQVKDTGIGISKSEQELVYDRFWRSEDPLTRQTGGTGLGLFVSQKLAKRIGATIKLESEPGRGTTFEISIPTIAVKSIDNKNVVKNELEHVLE